MINTLLIANRGEIAYRIMRSAKALGIRTVAVYSSQDSDALHVRSADTAVAIGAASAAESYLRGDRIIAAAKAAGAEAIHPGYGFLAENAEFAEQCAAAGLVFVGPPASAIRAMGSKSEAKALMHAAGVPVVPGYHGAAQDDATLTSQALAVGFPLLVKASAGGGGKGMRVVHAAEEFQAAVDSARREALSAFGDAQVLLERFIAAGRHVEIQVFFDSHGNGVHLFERDCSVQRRYQKVIEEAPAPKLSQDMRDAMYAAALNAGRAVAYEGAGTVELIVGTDEFFFMEMNTRLQVEHPVTEAITGIDLVEWQLLVAAGEALPLAQEQIRHSGHAVEVRLYAEDPARGFLPATGTLKALRMPPTGAGIRIDTGVSAGDEISIFYDPMIAKIIAHADTRETAIRRLQTALANTQIAGLTTNAEFLQRLLSHPEVLAGGVDTGVLSRDGEALAHAEVSPAGFIDAAAIWLALRANACAEQALASAEVDSPWNASDGWRMNHDYLEPLTLSTREGDSVTVLAHSSRGATALEADGQLIDYRCEQRDETTWVVTTHGISRQIGVHLDQQTLTLFDTGTTQVYEVADPLSDATDTGVSAGSLRAPMPGKIIETYVGVGDSVTAGQALLLMEAMKMEHPIIAPTDGTVTELRFSAGMQVEEGTELVVLDATVPED
jgi:3-methylcrotonyl-CoA carboxylase alpha subunit